VKGNPVDSKIAGGKDSINKKPGFLKDGDSDSSSDDDVATKFVAKSSVGDKNKPNPAKVDDKKQVDVDNKKNVNALSSAIPKKKYGEDSSDDSSDEEGKKKVSILDKNVFKTFNSVLILDVSDLIVNLKDKIYFI